MGIAVYMPCAGSCRIYIINRSPEADWNQRLLRATVELLEWLWGLGASSAGFRDEVGFRVVGVLGFGIWGLFGAFDEGLF